MKSIGSGSSKKKTKSTKVNTKKEKKVINKDVMACRIQCLARKYLARKHIRKLAQEVWRRVFDPKFDRYFWYDTLHDQSSWQKPRNVEFFTQDELQRVAKIQKVLRGFIHRMRARKVVNTFYTRYYDAEKNQFYYFDKRNQRTVYHVSKWLQRQQVAMPKEDQQLLAAQLKIKELESRLLEKERELKEVKVKRYEELEPLIIRDKVKAAENLVRSKHMDVWTTDDLAAWFTELKMEAYIPALYSNRVDGRLFVNLNDDEYTDLGIANKFHVRKLQLILKAFKARYQRKREKVLQREEDGADEEDEELLSEYSPSELSAILAAEDAAADDHGSSEGSSDEEGSYLSEEDEEVQLTAEQRLQREMDDENISAQMVMQGDNVNFPLPGDIVRVKYTVLMPDADHENPSLSQKQRSSRERVLMSTKNTLERPWVEFVLGVGQVVVGFDRALPLMSVGERTKFTFSPQYAYGKEGLPPHIPPNSSLIFDITLLEFRPRSLWVKPLIQELGVTNEKPHIGDLKISLERAHALGQTQRIATVLSASLLMNEGVDQNALAQLQSVRSAGSRAHHHTSSALSPTNSQANSTQNSVASGRASLSIRLSGKF